MGIENLQGFTPEQQVKYVEMRACYQAQGQIANIIEEIKWIGLSNMVAMKLDKASEEKAPTGERVRNYHFDTTAPLDVSEEDQRKSFERKMQPFLQGQVFDNNEEYDRLRNSFVRRGVLSMLGFGFSDDYERSHVVANWKEFRVGNLINFRIAQSPKDRSFFLTQTIINGDGRLVDGNVLSENILSAFDKEPDKAFKKAVKHWKEEMIGPKSPALTSLTQ